MRQIRLRWRDANGALGLLLLATTPIGAGFQLHLSRPPHDVGTLVIDPNVSAHAGLPENSVTRQAMRLTTDKARYRQGELITVTLANELSTTVLAPPLESGLCSVVSLERLAATGWVAEGVCHTGAAAPLISLGPRTVMTAALISPGSNARERAVVSHPARPATPAAQSGPTTGKPRQPSDLTPQYPEGIINVRGLLYPSVADLLSPGTYRIAFVYTVGTPAGPTRKTYAGPFEVTP